MNEQDSRQVLELYGDLVYRLAYARTGKSGDGCIRHGQPLNK